MDIKNSLNVINSIHEKNSKKLIKDHLQNSEQDRGLKRKYAIWFIWILITQLLLMNLLLFFVGFRLVTLQMWPLNLYMAGTLAETFGIVLVITKNLFPIQK